MPEPEEPGKRPENIQKKWPASVILTIPFFFIIVPLYRAARHEVNWRAVAAMVGTFEAVMIFAEHFSISRGHWVWNSARTLGPTIWGIPVEEPLLYYWFPPLFVVVLMHAFKKALTKQR